MEVMGLRGWAQDWKIVVVDSYTAWGAYQVNDVEAKQSRAWR